MRMSLREGAVTMHGDPLMLSGDSIQLGQDAPDVTLLDNDLNPFALSTLKGKVVVLCSVPSLDTPVCDIETRKFNEEAANLGDNVEVIAISMDLPFAQSRWCTAAGVERVRTLSDHRHGAFGNRYGLLIKELRLLARAVIVVDREGDVRYIEVVRELSEEPDYEAALQAIQGLV